MPYTDAPITSSDIVGSAAWAKLHGSNCEIVTRSSVFNSSTTRSSRRRKKQRNIKRTPTYSQVLKNRRRVDKIINFTYSNSWQQIEGGTHNNKWLNPQYKNKLFESGKIYELGTGETHYFPISDTFDDPIGIAMNYHLDLGSNTYDIRPNVWKNIASTRKGRKRIKKLKYQEARRKTKEAFKQK